MDPLHEKINQKKNLMKLILSQDPNEREQFLAQTLVGRGVLERKVQDKKTSTTTPTNMR